MRRLVLMTDGYVGEHGAGWAFVARVPDHSDTISSGALALGTASHEAEWAAVAAALAWAEAHARAGDELEIRTDSALVAKGLASRRPALSGPVAETRAQCRQALARLGAAGVRARVERVRREDNELADALARSAATRTDV